MDVYIGMDISLHSTHVCMVNAAGEVLQEGSARSEVSELDAYLRTHTRSFAVRRIVFETGQLSTILFHGLAQAGWVVACIDARHAHGVLQTQRVKTDRNDARGLAQLARTGWYQEVHVQSAGAVSLRLLVQGRHQLGKLRRDMENHIRGVLKTFGIRLGLVPARHFRERVLAMTVPCDALVRETMVALLAAREGLCKQEAALAKRCRQLAKADSVCQRLLTVPGVGAITALTFKAEIDDPSRFAKSRDVGVHLGLTPRRYASGEIDRSGGISKGGSASMRSVLFEAAVVLLTRTKKWSRLKAWGVALAKRKGSFKMACTAVARKLAVILHRMWRDGTDFIYGSPPRAEAV